MDLPILEICDDELGEGWLRKYFHHLRQQLHANARRLQPQTPLPDVVTKTDEMFQKMQRNKAKNTAIRPKRIPPQFIAALVYCTWFRDEPFMAWDDFCHVDCGK